MAVGTIIPLPKLQLFTDNGDVAAGYQLFTYEAGTTTKLDTYSDVNLTVPNTNPIILDSAGRATVFLSDASYKIVFADDTDTDPPTSPIWTVDGVMGTATSNANIDITGTAGETVAIGETVYLSALGSGGLIAGRWYLTNSDHNYASVDASTLGMVQSGGDGGDDIVVRTSGRATTTGTLSSGTIYYLSDTPGTLDSSSAQQNRCPFGQADSTSTIIFPIGGTISISIKNALATFGYASGQGCANDGLDTELTSYPVTVPDNYLYKAGDTIVVEGTLALAADAHLKAMKMSIGSSGLLLLFSNSDNLAGHIVPFRFNLIRRADETKAAVTGLFYYKAAHQGTPSVYLCNHAISGTVGWDTAQDLKLYLSSDGSHADCIKLTDLYIYSTRSPYGTTV